MSVTFWKDVRTFHSLLNLAHDGVLTSTELTVTFPKVLEGMFGLKSGQMSTMSYQESLEAYINRLYSVAYPEYFTSKLIQQSKAKIGNTIGLEKDESPIQIRSELPLLLPHFEQDFIHGLGKEEEAVLHVDLQHSISTIEQYYKNINNMTEQQMKQYLPIFLRALRNTHYIPDNAQIVDLEIHLSKATLPSDPLVIQPNSEQSSPTFVYHIELKKIRLLFVALAAFLYDSHKTKAISRSYNNPTLGCSTNNQNHIKTIFDRDIPDLLSPNYSVREVDVTNEAQLMLQQMMMGNALMFQQQNEFKHENDAEIDDEGNTIGNLPQIFKNNADKKSILPPATIDSDLLNHIFKYMIYGISFQQYLAKLIANPYESYNPFTTYNNVAMTEEEIVNNPHKSDKEKAILLTIHKEQSILNQKLEASKQVEIIQSFTLTTLLNMVFRTYSHTVNISTSVVAINDYIGEVTYGDEEDDDSELSNMFAMMMGGLTPDFEQESKQIMVVEEQLKKQYQEQNDILRPSHELTASRDETMKLMNARWLTSVRRSMNWAHAFTISQLVPTRAPGGLTFAKLDGSSMSMDVMKKTMQNYDEQCIIDGYQQFDLVSQMRASRRR